MRSGPHNLMGRILFRQAYWSSPPLANLYPPSIMLMKNLDLTMYVLLSLHSPIKTQQKNDKCKKNLKKSCIERIIKLKINKTINNFILRN